jgi:hypothetical protein
VQVRGLIAERRSGLLDHLLAVRWQDRGALPGRGRTRLASNGIHGWSRRAIGEAHLWTAHPAAWTGTTLPHGRSASAETGLAPKVGQQGSGHPIRLDMRLSRLGCGYLVVKSCLIPGAVGTLSRGPRPARDSPGADSARCFVINGLNRPGAVPPDLRHSGEEPLHSSSLCGKDKYHFVIETWHRGDERDVASR